ncbi:hypothetical protein B296_00034912 [Ensete ventricosum]|uniref:Secreted protein n=1 Tax=Ensete ventricosum TaxID=4639 RepID=A0A426X9E5_ENSVE|nr:hypothetical protein B296_00034912 [Ensete ventricosum]
MVWSCLVVLHIGHSKVESLYSGCCRSSVPGNLAALVTYHVVIHLHHARRPCGRPHDPWRPPYLRPTSFPRRVGHVQLSEEARM